MERRENKTWKGIRKKDRRKKYEKKNEWMNERNEKKEGSSEIVKERWKFTYKGRKEIIKHNI